VTPRIVLQPDIDVPTAIPPDTGLGLFPINRSCSMAFADSRPPDRRRLAEEFMTAFALRHDPADLNGLWLPTRPGPTGALRQLMDENDGSRDHDLPRRRCHELSDPLPMDRVYS